MAETRSTLVDNATMLVRRHGYAGFSYADLAEVVGIRKASIHHHFASKEDLGVEIVAVYTQRFAERLSDVAESTSDLRGRLEGYAALYRAGLATGEGCLCGVLASELAGLPARIRTMVECFFALNLEWLETILGEASPPGEGRAEHARQQARTVLATLQGGVFVALAMGKPDTFDASVSGLLEVLAPRTSAVAQPSASSASRRA